MFSKFRHRVFWPAFGLLVSTLLLSMFNKKYFLAKATAINEWILHNFGWLFSLSTLLMVICCVLLFVSPLGKRRIGGADAKPLLSRWRWFSITLCTTIATGILFWGTAEPMYHVQYPPEGLGVPANETATFAMSTMYLHWSFTPYAIYCIPTVVFALAFYNQRLPFSLASTLFPFLGGQAPKWLSIIVDTVCLFALVAGMASSLGTGVLTLMGGVIEIFDIQKSTFLLAMVCVAVVATFIVSAASGLQKGIRTLSTINIYGFIAICLFIFLLGPIGDVLTLAWDGLLHYFAQFGQKSLYTILQPEDTWGYSWTVFYWANWMAWAPITAMFLGRISKGYTIREILLFNWIFPSLFAIVWMSVFSGTAISFNANEVVNLTEVQANLGDESVVYAILKQFPAYSVMLIIFVVVVFLSYVTAADSNTEAMGAITTHDIIPEKASPPVWIKITWGICIGATAFIMVSYAGIEGIKMISNLGGFPALWLLIFITLGLIKLMLTSFSRPSAD